MHAPEGLALVSPCCFDLSGIRLFHLANCSPLLIAYRDVGLSTDVQIKRILVSIRSIGGP